MKKNLLITLTIAYVQTIAQGTWTQKANFGGTPRNGAVGFSIGNKGYIGTGFDNLGPQNDFWEWDQGTNTWTQKANFAGGVRIQAVAFSIGTKGYIGTGYDGINLHKDLWEWDQGTNTWTQKANLPGTIERLGAVGFSIGAKGYIGTGQQGFTLYNDLWEWDQGTNTWTQKANFGGVPRYLATSFSIGNKGYIGTGSPGGNDLWEWDQGTNSWTQKSNFPGVAQYEAVGFSIGSNGYVGTGYSGGGTKEFWEFNPSTNSWAQMANFGGTARRTATGFSIGCFGYIGVGYDDVASAYQNDFWEYTPVITSCNLSVTVLSVQPICNGQCTGTASASPLGGTSPYSYLWNNSQTTQNISGLCAGSYSVIVTDSLGATTTSTFTITQPPVLAATVSVTSTSCGSNNGSAMITASGGTPGYFYSWSPSGQTSQSATGLSPGTYTVTTTDVNGCTTLDTITVAPTTSVTAVAGPNNTICAGQSTMVTASGGGTYLWSTGSTGSVINVSPAFSTTYSVIVSIGNCSDTASVTVIVNPGPAANAGSDVSIIQGQTATLTASGGGTYSWSNGDSANPIAVSPSATTTYTVVVADTNGCTSIATVTVYVEIPPCGNLYIPNAFSPNQDGENEVLYLLGDCIENMKLVIYNRWGEKVFESDDQSIGWDGNYNGKSLDAAVFAYILQATLTMGEKVNKKGNISLIR